MGYSVIIGVYDGIKYLDFIIKAIKEQSVPPQDITVWINFNNSRKFDLEFKRGEWPDVKYIYCTSNYGVYARFSAGLLSQSERIMVLDDDTIPGKDWALNCIKTVEKVGDNSIIGYRGIRLHKDTLYDIEAYEKGTPEITEVDLVGQCWWIKKEHILTLFEQEPLNLMNGEDTHLSACNQIKYKTKTYVPKQLLTEPSTIGSTKQHLGALPGRLSTSLGPQRHLSERKIINEYWISKGWKLCS